MATATIDYDAKMMGWPPITYLVKLSEPMKRFDPETGAATTYEYVAMTLQEAEPKQAYVFPSNENGDAVDLTMTPMRTRDYDRPIAVLDDLGYTLTTP